MFLKLYR